MGSMMRSPTPSLLGRAWLAVALSLGLAACGGGGSGITTADTAPSIPQPSQNAQVAAFAQAQRSVMAAPARAPLVAVADNMVTNGSFESGMAGWSDWGNSMVVAGQASGGTSSLQVGTGAGGAGQVVGAIVPGTTYRLTARAKVGTASDNVYVGVNFTDAGGQPVKQNAELVASTDYKAVTLEIVAPPDAVNALVYVWKNAGSGYAYVDEFNLAVVGGVQPGPAASANLVGNGAFDNGFSGWDLWGNSQTTTDAASGTAAARVGTGEGGFGQRIAGVSPGSNYHVSARAKLSSAMEVAYLGVMFTDDAGNGLAVQNAVIRSTTYEAVQADLMAPAGATHALVFVWKNAGDGYAYVDDIALVQLSADPNAPGSETVTSAPAGAPVSQLPWGGEVSGQVVAVGSNTLRRYGADGAQIGSAVTVNFGGNTGSATVLQGGGYAAAWVESVGSATGPSYQLYTQAFDAAAQPIGSPVAVALTRVADDLGNPAAVPQLAPLTGGGYVVVWALQQAMPGGTNDRGVYAQRFDAQGQPMGAAQQATPDGTGFLHVTGTANGGFVVAWGKSSGATGGARAYGADGQPVAPEQVAGISWHTGAGPRGAIAPLAGGGAVIVGQVQGGPVVVQHLSAAGIAQPAQVASSLGSPTRAFVATAGLPDGGSLVAWFEPGGNVYARRFAADGTPAGPQTQVNQVTTPSNGTEIMVFADGTFAIAWDVGSTRYARRYPANGLTAP